MDDRLAELNPKPRTCVVFGGRGFLGRSLVLRLLKLGKWIVRVADSTQSLHLDPSERDSLLSQALSSGIASLHGVDVRDKSQIITGKIFSEFLFSFVFLFVFVFVFGWFLSEKMRANFERICRLRTELVQVLDSGFKY